MRSLSLILLLCMVMLVGATDFYFDENKWQPPAVFDNIHVQKLTEDSLSSTFLIWVKKEVLLHMHQYHTEHVLVLEGKAEMVIGSDERIIKPGDFMTIPKNTPHRVKVLSSDPLKVISIQSPKFLGKDRMLMEPVFNDDVSFSND